MHKVKLYIHFESDLLRALFVPAARRQNPKKRPQVLTRAQRELWEVITGNLAPAEYAPGRGDDVWDRSGTFRHTTMTARAYDPGRLLDVLVASPDRRRVRSW